MQPDPTLDAKILIVDNEPHIVDMVRAALQSAGYTSVESTTRSADALELYQAVEPDLIILDMKMPGVHGMDILHDLHEIVPTDQYLPILVITGDRRTELKMQALAWGAKDFLPKPFEMPELLLRVRLLLDTRLLFGRLNGARRPDAAGED